jgi:hypothetical protein
MYNTCPIAAHYIRQSATRVCAENGDIQASHKLAARQNARMRAVLGALQIAWHKTLRAVSSYEKF